MMTDDCADDPAMCTNTVGSSTCSCPDGYTGTGFTASPCAGKCYQHSANDRKHFDCCVLKLTCSDGRVVRASASEAVDSGLIQTNGFKIGTHIFTA